MYKKIVNTLNNKEFKFIAIITTIFMFAAHGFVYLNTIFTHDSMKIMYWGEYLSYDSIEIGRFIIPLLLIIRGKYYPPFLIGMLSIILMVLLVYFLVKLFDLKNKKLIALLSGVLSSSCTITLLNATYIEYSDMYILSFLLATLSVYFLVKGKGLLRVILSIISFVIGMGIYQTTLPLFITLVLIYTIFDIINSKKIKNVFKSFCVNMGTGAIASGVYFIAYKVVLKILNIVPSNKYNSMNNLAKFENIGDIFNIISKQYEATINFITHPSTYYKFIVVLVNVTLIVLSIFSLIILSIKKRKSILQSLSLIVLVIGLSFSVNCTFFLSHGVLHHLMIFPMFMFYVFLVVLIEMLVKEINVFRPVYKFVLISLALIVVSSIIYSNQIYLKKQMEFETTKLTMNRIIENIEEMDEYNVQTTPIVFVGYLKDGPIAYKKAELDYLSVGQDSPYGLTYYLTYKQFLNNYMGYPVNVLDKDTSLKFGAKKEVQKMEVFPSKKAYKIVDGVLVIKMGPYSY